MTGDGTGREDDLAFQVMNEIGIVAQLGSTLFEAVMPHGMTLAQFSVLNHFVRLGGPKRPSDLARAFQVSKPTMTSTLGRLEAKGFVASAPDGRDGRGRLVDLTPAGRAARADAVAALAPALDALGRAVGPEPFGAALPPLRAIRAALDALRSP